MHTRWLQRGLDLLAAHDIAGVEALLAADGAGGVDPADHAELAGACALARGAAAKAARHYAAALAARPDSPQAHCGLGSALSAQGQFRAAAASFQRAADLAPDCVEALIGQGECSLELGDYEDARDCFEIARAHAPQSWRAMCGIGRLLRLSGDAAGSVCVLQEALLHSGAHLGESAELYLQLGLSCNHAGDVAGAIDAYERALAVDAQHAGALVNLGLIYLTQTGEPARAQALFEFARAAHPQSVAVQANYGLALQEQGQFELALAHYESLVGQNPQAIEYRWNRAIAYLQHGDFARGWPDYELRHTRGGRDVRRDFGLPIWSGEAPQQHHLLVYGEQGVGDEIMFASCLPELARGAAGVVLECDARLATLFARSFPDIHVHGAARDGASAWLRQYPALDRQIAIGSLPHLMRRQATDFPAHGGYLAPDAERVAAWRERLAGGGDALAVGLSWRGGTRKTRGGLRSLESADCLPLAQARRCRFVCLQRGDCAEEIAAARAGGLELQWWPQALDDIEETAALIAALELVISVGSTVAHLAGALGRPCWTMLANVPDWRYGVQGATMPWYPSLRLFRQTQSRDWRPVVMAVEEALTAWSPG